VYLELHAGIEKAEELIRKAVAITPDHRAYYLDTLGVVLLRPGRTEESLAALKQALELMPGDNAGHLAEAHLHLAEAYRIAGDAASAGEAEQAAKKYRAPQ
jgi:tetratricopeptide (TPR) repeat protein